MNISGSSSQWTDDLPIYGSYTYHISDIHSEQSTRWVYEWVDPDLYNMCYQDWQSTAEWTTSYGRNIRHIFFEPNVLCSYRRRSIMQCSMRNQCSGLFLCTMYDSYVIELCIMYDSHGVYLRVLRTICMYNFSRCHVIIFTVLSFHLSNFSEIWPVFGKTRPKLATSVFGKTS
jgi:hypothetical protein